jgi:hypothetical protein
MNPDPQTLECMKKLDKFNETGCTNIAIFINNGMFK